MLLHHINAMQQVVEIHVSDSAANDDRLSGSHFNVL